MYTEVKIIFNKEDQTFNFISKDSTINYILNSNKVVFSGFPHFNTQDTNVYIENSTGFGFRRIGEIVGVVHSRILLHIDDDIIDTAKASMEEGEEKEAEEKEEEEFY